MCKCGHGSGQHGLKFPHRCACDRNDWIDGHGTICDCQGFEQDAEFGADLPEPYWLKDDAQGVSEELETALRTLGESIQDEDETWEPGAEAEEKPDWRVFSFGRHDGVTEIESQSFKEFLSRRIDECH